MITEETDNKKPHTDLLKLKPPDSLVSWNPKKIPIANHCHLVQTTR